MPIPVSVSYAIEATGVADAEGTYTDAPGLGYSTAADGTLTQQTANQVSGFTLAPGQTLFVRFKDFNVAGTDRFSRIDNVSIVVPEPASLGLVGLAVAGATARRRRAR